MSQQDLSPIDHRLAHKSSADGLLFAGYRTLEEGSVLELRLARGWMTSQPWAVLTPPEVLIAEALRQAVILHAHLCHEADLNTVFVMDHMSFELLGDFPAGTTDVIVGTRDDSEGEQGMRSVIAEFQFIAQGRAWAHGEGHLRVIPAPVYEEIRPNRLSSEEFAAVQPLPAGYVIASVTPQADTVTYDPKHPLFFDHPIDHVPGMLLIGAAIDSFATRAPSSELRQVRATFTDYVELSEQRSVAMTSEPLAGATAIGSTPRRIGAVNNSARSSGQRVTFFGQNGPAVVIDVSAPGSVDSAVA